MTPGAAPATRQAALDFTINREVRLHDEPHRHWWGKFKSPLRHVEMLVNADLERADLHRANLGGTSPSDLKP